MDKTSTRRAKPTPADLAAATRLRKLWDEAVTDRATTENRLTQDLMVERFNQATGRGSQGLVSQYLNGRIPLNYRAVRIFAQEIGCRPEEIRSDLPEFDGQGSSSSDEGWTDVLGVRQGFAMGAGVVPDEYAETHKLKFRADSLRRKGLRADRLMVYYGDGDSMEPTINDGDAIMADLSDTKPRDEKLYVINYGGELFAKRLVQIGDVWCISSDNTSDPKWRKPIPIDSVKGFEVLGRIRWIAGWED